MGNPLKGEVGFEAGAASFTLVYNIDALCTLEDRLDLSVAEIGERMGKTMRLGFLRAVFHAGLRAHHPEVTERQAGELISVVGLAETGDLIGKAFTLAFPEAAKGAARPRRAGAADGTGPASTRPGRNSASRQARRSGG